MNSKYRLSLFILLFAGIALLIAGISHGHNLAILNPMGMIADKERHLMIVATLLMLIVVIPVFVLTAVISWRYRAGNAKATYAPNWDHSVKAEFVWWGLPLVIIMIIGALTWRSSHELDPFKPIEAAAKPLTIQVVAMRWKWLFIYPDQRIATVNYVQIPENTPVNFVITSDGPMNSFWVPQLGGQIYAMPGMSTQMHLVANQLGEFKGSSANLSGSGFSGMKFTVASAAPADFQHWVRKTQAAPAALGAAEYAELALPSEDTPAAAYAVTDDSLFTAAVMKFMAPSPEASAMPYLSNMPSMEMQ